MVVTKPAAYPVGHPFAPPLEAVRGVPGVSSVTFPNCWLWPCDMVSADRGEVSIPWAPGMS